eukprot:9695322-Alexandrium_andersonii.AAC.1
MTPAWPPPCQQPRPVPGLLGADPWTGAPSLPGATVPGASMPSQPPAQPCDRAGPAPPLWARPQRDGASASVLLAGTSPRDTTMIAIRCILPNGAS